MQTASIEKHLFYGTNLVLLYLGSLGSVFRNDDEAKVVSFVCATILFALSVLYYLNRKARIR